jgi:hypothetical protein
VGKCEKEEVTGYFGNVGSVSVFLLFGSTSVESTVVILLIDVWSIELLMEEIRNNTTSSKNCHKNLS